MAEANAKAAEKAAKEREASIQKLEEQALCDAYTTHTCVGAVLCTHVCMYLVTDCRWPWPGGRVEEACDGHAQGEEGSGDAIRARSGGRNEQEAASED